ncbi:LamG-like jellyroll fold domain-containing protein [Pirellulimonas nuda]|nr:LamG-like jellyroll fold domain-containing protein [Pirellulimonas nuda]
MLGLLRNWLQSTDAILAYDVSVPIHLDWNADHPGNNTTLWGAPPEITRWRSQTNVDDYQREHWVTAGWSGANTPRVALESQPHQPGLGSQAFRFTPNNLMVTASFHVGDSGDSFVGNLLPASKIDHDRSATFELWVKFKDLAAEQTLFESGHTTEGLSLTVGDADANGRFNDLRFRALGDDGQSLTTTVALDQFVNPTSEFIHIVGVINDSPTDRYTAVYVNGALLGRTNGVLGAAGSIDWDGYINQGDALATIGKVAAANLGGNSGPAGTRPFSGGGLSADLSQIHFRNYALSDAEVRGEYNLRLAPVGWGVLAAGGNAFLATERPSDVSRDVFETGGSMTVLHERLDTLKTTLAVDLKPTAGGSYAINGTALPGGNLSQGQKVSSYLIHFDALASAATGVVEGSFTFAAPVLGLLVSDASLTATDKVLGAIGRYSLSGKGLAIDDLATISLSSDLRTLTVSMTATASDFFELRVLTAAPGLIPGDFDGNGMVDQADYLLWKRDFGTSSYLADGNGDGVVNSADYTVWRDHLGQSVPGSAAAALASAAVPEPGSLVLLALALGGLRLAAVARFRGVAPGAA